MAKKITISVYGGLVQEVWADDPELDVEYFDYDGENEDEIKADAERMKQRIAEKTPHQVL